MRAREITCESVERGCTLPQRVGVAALDRRGQHLSCRLGNQCSIVGSAETHHSTVCELCSGGLRLKSVSLTPLCPRREFPPRGSGINEKLLA